jgi:hypothetical protein
MAASTHFQPSALQGFGIGLQLREHELFEQRRILEPAAAILLEQIAQDDAAGLLIGFGTDIDGAAVVGPDRRVGEQPADVIGLTDMGARDRLPDPS